MQTENTELTRAQESRNAIERLYIEMRHLFNRGTYKPSGISGSVVRSSLRILNPEIYGSINDPQKVELNGLVYVMDRLPKGIEECRYIKFTSEEGLRRSGFEPIMPLKRRRNCYRIDENQMNIEVTRGRSEIYDVMTHLTFVFNEAEKITNNAFRENGVKTRDWLKLEKLVMDKVELTSENQDAAFSYLSTILGRTFEETRFAYERLGESPHANKGLFNIVYWLGRLTHEEEFYRRDREISFTPALRERIGRHIHGEKWAFNIKKELIDQGLFERPMHIISANLHSVMNCIYAYPALKDSLEEAKPLSEIALELRKEGNGHLGERIQTFADAHGMTFLEDVSGTNLAVQIFDLAQVPARVLAPELEVNLELMEKEPPVLIVMDYAFGEQAYEAMDELLKPIEYQGKKRIMPVASISIMGKAGILTGGKGDIMIPNAHVFEGTADNYPFENEFTAEDFQELPVCTGPMITVLGTSLQNKDVLSYFKESSWQAIGLEMEGAHYQKAIQAEAKIRRNIDENIILRYAYYASDNPLVSGSTLASGSLGLVGVKPTYLITSKILQKILNPSVKKKIKNSKKSEKLEANHQK